MATMDPGQRGLGRPMRRQGPVDRLDESIGERSRGGRIPPELLQMLVAALMGGQGGGGAQRRSPMGDVGQRQAMQAAQRGRQRPPQRPPSGRPPMGGGGRPPVVKIEDLVRALSGGGAQRQAPQANMPVPQARR